MSEKTPPSLGALISMGAALALCVVGGVGGGYWLDRTLHTGEVLTFVGLALGVAAAIAIVYFNAKTFL